MLTYLLQAIAFSAVVVAANCGLQARDTLSADSSDPELIWQQITPSNILNWTACYSEPFQCARLRVPLSYDKPEGAVATIAMIRIPATVPVNSSEYKGPILTNPGGPGVPGVDFLLVDGLNLSKIVGPQFDVVSFDPRGIYRSTPEVSLFVSDAERALFSARLPLGSFNSTPADIPHAWGEAQLAGRLAFQMNGAILDFINTDHTARDMLQIVEAHGRKQLQYWGFSYGSVLGSTFAAMFPDRVERLVIDGVEDPKNYYSTLWSDNLLDTDKVMDSFYTGCSAAGPSKCAFWESTPAKIKAKLLALYDSVRAQPIPVQTSSSYGLIDYDYMRYTIFGSLYTPYALYQRLAQGLADLQRGNGTAFYEIANPGQFECDCTGGTTAKRHPEGAWAIACNDGAQESDGVAELRRDMEQLGKVSEWADAWMSIRIICSGWPKQNKTWFRGPVKGNTSHPLLLIGNTADPVTPLHTARITSKDFPGSVVLTQDCAGHTSLASPSVCTAKYVRAYFVNGTLPKEDTVCQADAQPFEGNGTQAVAARGLELGEGGLDSEGDEELLATLDELASRKRFRGSV